MTTRKTALVPALLFSIAVSVVAAAQSTGPWVPTGGRRCPANWLTTPAPDPEWNLPPLVRVLPLQYYDTRFAGFLFPAPASALQTALPPGLNVYQPVEGVGLLALAFQSHRANEYLQPYNELAVSILVAPEASDNPALVPLYSVAFVVTTEEARWVGSQAWGYEKILGSVEFDDRTFTASANGQPIVTIHRDAAAPGPATPSLSYLIFSVKDGMLVRAPWIPVGVLSNYNGSAVAELGEHPFAQYLATLGFGAFPSMQQQLGEHVASTLYAGRCSPPGDR